MEKELGQLLMVGFLGTKPPPEFCTFLREENIGSVLLLARNIVSAKQLREVTAALQAAAAQPLLIAIDNEGGRIFRCPPPFTHVPAMRQVARTAEREGPEIITQVGRVLATELRAAGVNWNFVPVLDVDTNPFNPIIGDRAFSSDPHVVADFGCRLIRAFEDEGVMSCGKHFPGHGDTDLDSHMALPLLPHTRKRFELCEFVPFRAAIAAGVPAIMTAHVLVPLLDPDFPASISTRITTGILRRDLGYDGLVITDYLSMQGIAERCTVPEATVLAIKAGADIAMLDLDHLSIQRETLARLQSAMTNGEIPRSRIETALTRVARAKARYAQ